MASTLHTATAFWLLVPCDFLCLHTQSDTHIAGRSGIPLRYAFLSPAVGKQSLLSSPHFLSLLTFPLSLYNFIFFPPEKSPVVCVHFFLFLVPHTNLMTVFAKCVKTWETGQSLFYFLSYVFVIWKNECVFLAWPPPLLL